MKIFTKNHWVTLRYPSRSAIILAVFVAGLPFCAVGRADTPLSIHRGINYSSWLANAPRQPIYARDVIQTRDAGFDHIRLPFNPEYYGYKQLDDGQSLIGMDWIPLDRAVQMAEDARMPLIIDLHPGGDFLDSLERHRWAEDDFVELWKAIAERYRSHSPQSLMFELLNEPQYYHSEAMWNRLVARSIKSIRSISPKRIIIVGAPHGSDIDALKFLETSHDPNTLYSFHFYEPYIITHQGIHMGFEKEMIRAFRQVPYPAALASEPASVYAPDANDKAEAAHELKTYKDADWDDQYVAKRIQIAADWALAHGVRLVCGEFGVLRNHIDAGSRYRWIKDVRTALDADAIGWEVWDYADLFGITRPVGPTSVDPVDGSIRLTDPERGTRVFEPEALNALGLPEVVR